MLSYHNAPVIRNFRNGKPIMCNVININRSDWIRRIFTARGNIKNWEVQHFLEVQGMKASDSLINVQRQKLIAKGII